MGVDLEAPDHTTLSRRGQSLAVELHHLPTDGPIHLIIDSTGLSIVGEGEWAAPKYGARGRRGWKKLHVGVDRSGVIVAHALTDSTVDDATTGIDLINAVAGDVASVTRDAAYDTVGFYTAAGDRGARVMAPPAKTANLSRRGPRSGVRDRTIARVRALGRRRWKKASGYHGPESFPARTPPPSFRSSSPASDARVRRMGCGDVRLLNRRASWTSRGKSVPSSTS